MGAARKNDPTQIRTAEFWKVEGCPLARSLRKFFKANGRFPAKKFKCVYSPEQSAKSGTLATVVGSFGFLLASMLIDDAIKERNK